jgi:penicillin-binding protein 1A
MSRRRALLGSLLAVASGLGACTYASRAIDPPDAEEIESSTLYAADGTLVHTFHAEENRKVIPLEEIPVHVREAVIAIEDERFYRHNGVDPRAILRAARRNVEAGEAEQGGSTITQQYVKQEILQDDSPTFERKLQEASTAIQLERRYSKDRILELYLNAIYFGNGAYGIEAAAHQYFGKPTADLTLEEGALIAGLIQRPGTTDPFRAPEAALERRRLVLEQMLDNEMITDAEAYLAGLIPLRLASGIVPAAERYPAAYFVEEVKQWILDDPRFGATAKERRDLLFGGGLRIHTTVDLEMQAQAEAAVGAILPDVNGPAASLVSIEPTTGYVRAMVGGRDFFGTGAHDKFNLATQSPGRHSGSSFKPFILAAAIEQGIDPFTTRFNAPACITIPLPDEAWSPCNAEVAGEGRPTIAEGTVHSINTLYAQLIMEVGPQAAIDVARRLGIQSPLEPYPSAVLGTNDVTTYDMASAFATFANLGVHVPPTLVTKITRTDGTTLYTREHTQQKVIDADTAATVSSILQGAVERGTGTRARLDRPVAGKTGTTDDYRNAWFVGYTPELSTAVWVGFSETQVSMRPPATPIKVFGGTYPAQIWQRFMSAALAGRPVLPFQVPTTTTTTPPGSLRPPTPTTLLGPPQPVPDVVGRSVDEAVEVLRTAGFRVETVPAAQGSKPPDVVKVQSPSGGSEAPRGSTVTLEVTEPNDKDD